MSRIRSGGNSGDRDRRHLHEGEVCRLGRDVVLAGAGVLGEGAFADTHHLVAEPKSGHVLADCLDVSGHLTAPDRVLRLADPEEWTDQIGQAGHEMPDAAVDPGGADADQHLVVLDVRLVDVPELEHVGRAVRVLDNGLHRGLRLRWWVAYGVRYHTT
ncbi:MAG TPA: hypothetical protein VHI11_00725 [Jiangellaceae bacterium]|jgi:hypothetical protein|nr:hypothetical protein [Jiangellaceae bacterium]